MGGKNFKNNKREGWGGGWDKYQSFETSCLDKRVFSQNLKSLIVERA